MTEQADLAHQIMETLPTYLEHHKMVLKYYAGKEGDPHVLAAQLMKELEALQNYPQTKQFLQALTQAIENFRQGNYTLLPNGKEYVYRDGICQACRYCFLGIRKND